MGYAEGMEDGLDRDNKCFILFIIFLWFSEWWWIFPLIFCLYGHFSISIHQPVSHHQVAQHFDNFECCRVWVKMKLNCVVTCGDLLIDWVRPPPNDMRKQFTTTFVCDWEAKTSRQSPGDFSRNKLNLNMSQRQNLFHHSPARFFTKRESFLLSYRFELIKVKSINHPAALQLKVWLGVPRVEVLSPCPSTHSTSLNVLFINLWKLKWWKISQLAIAI